ACKKTDILRGSSVPDDLTSSGAFDKSVAPPSVEILRRNKLPACLSAVALALTTALAMTSDFDERPHYRRFVLPEIEKAEKQFFDAMDEAAQTSNDLWRVRYFIEAHRRAKAALRAIRSAHAMTATGRKAQSELIRYYESVDEELAIIRTEMSFNESYDYMAEWQRKNTEMLPIRQQWASWVNASSQ